MSEMDRNSTSSTTSSTASEIRERAMQAYDSALDSASSAGRTASESIEEAPLIALGAGIAAGALLAALLPTSRRERDLLRPYGNRVTGAARDAADAAKRAGSDKLRELGLTPDVLADKASEAAKATAQAAVGTISDSGKR
jgi:hypothetical protein